MDLHQGSSCSFNALLLVSQLRGLVTSCIIHVYSLYSVRVNILGVNAEVFDGC